MASDDGAPPDGAAGVTSGGLDAVSAQKKDRVSTQAFPPGGRPVDARFVGSFACVGGPAAQEWRLFRNRFEAPTSTAVSSPPSPIRTPVQRFDETIGGRRYQIEVSAVSSNRWRAQIVRAPGCPDRDDAVLRRDARCRRRPVERVAGAGAPDRGAAGQFIIGS